MDAKRFLSIDEFAEALSKPRCTIESWIRRGVVRFKVHPRGTKMANRRFTVAEVNRIKRRIERGLPI